MELKDYLAIKRFTPTLVTIFNTLTDEGVVISLENTVFTISSTILKDSQFILHFKSWFAPEYNRGDASDKSVNVTINDNKLIITATIKIVNEEFFNGEFTYEFGPDGYSTSDFTNHVYGMKYNEFIQKLCEAPSTITNRCDGHVTINTPNPQ